MLPSRGRGTLAAVLLGVGLMAMVVPPLVRDGICGVFGCADQVPDIAVTRTAQDGVAVLVPAGAAPGVRVVRLLEGGQSSGAQRWMVRRTVAGARADDGGGSAAGAPQAFVAGEEPAGFRTVTELDGPPAEGRWVAEVSFRCTTASLPFSPSTLEVGEVRSWTGATDGRAFAAAARTEERCGTDRGTVERALFWVGLVAALAGAVLGIVVVLARPVDEEEDEWSHTA